jgi:hypothetical protein
MGRQLYHILPSVSLCSQSGNITTLHTKSQNPHRNYEPNKKTKKTPTKKQHKTPHENSRKSGTENDDTNKYNTMVM